MHAAPTQVRKSRNSTNTLQCKNCAAKHVCMDVFCESEVRGTSTHDSVLAVAPTIHTKELGERVAKDISCHRLSEVAQAVLSCCKQKASVFNAAVYDHTCICDTLRCEATRSAPPPLAGVSYAWLLTVRVPGCTISVIVRKTKEPLGPESSTSGTPCCVRKFASSVMITAVPGSNTSSKMGAVTISYV